ncbi:type i site-specific restriction-modification system s subunit [Faecalibacterium sp. CAG:1138]|nr:type i site-specific restriction-modification system s subunit [Faecalibacterium sp. CAG:1138]
MREMKDSGISWVGEIPKEWSVWRNKYIFKITKDIVLPSKSYQLLSLTTTGIKEKDENDNGGKVPENYDGYQIVKENDLVMCLFDLDCSAVFSGLSPYNGMISPAYKVLKVKKRIANEQYYRYWFNYVGSKRFYKQYSKSLRFTLNADEFNRLFSLLPPLDEQQRIAEFLDRECGKIDGLKADIQAQIDTLEQYKRSVITEAVTHGLNPSAPMKDSGIPWVGQFPTHWTKKKGKYILRYMSKPVKQDDGVITCFRDGEVTLRSNRREDGFTMADKEIGYQGVDVGDLVVHGMDGFAGAIGISDSRGKASPVLNVLNTKQNKKYIMYYLRSMAYGDVFTALSTGIRVRSCDLRWNKLAELLYPLPPIDEQNNIVNYIDEQIARTNEIIADKKSQIETLDGYKKSLIYEYVTGKKEVG